MASWKTMRQVVDEMITRAAMLQNLTKSEAWRRAELFELAEIYRAWYRDALGILAQHERTDLQKPFMDAFEGSWAAHRIKSFLKLGWKPHKISTWVTPFARSFREPLERQLDLLAAVGIDVSGRWFMTVVEENTLETG
jgi:hypothetical protein